MRYAEDAKNECIAIRRRQDALARCRTFSFLNRNVHGKGNAEVTPAALAAQLHQKRQQSCGEDLPGPKSNASNPAGRPAGKSESCGLTVQFFCISRQGEITRQRRAAQRALARRQLAGHLDRTRRLARR